jgi:hypothetical protein
MSPLSRASIGFPVDAPQIARSPANSSAADGPAGISRSSPALWFVLIIGLLVLARLIYEWGEHVD